jgi:lipopolysaccharide transport system permease protein
VVTESPPALGRREAAADRPDGAAPRPPRPRLGAETRELWRSRELIGNLVRRDLKVRHRGTFLGMLWSLATPLLTVALYYFVFRLILRALPVLDHSRPDGNNVPFAIYFFAGLTIWNFFGNSVGNAAGSIVSSGYLLNKVYFPRAILPLSVVLSSLITFGFELAILMVTVLLVVGLPSAHLLWLPVIVAVAALLSYGLALLLSTLTVFLRDVAHFVGIFLQLWFWGTPIIYSLQWVASNDEGLVRILRLNPMTGVVVAFRNVVLLNHAPPFRLLAYSAVVGLVMLVLGTYVFSRSQRLFSEIV